MSYCVDVVEKATRQVIKTVGPVSSYDAADRVERGMLINMSDRFFTVVRWQDEELRDAPEAK